MREFCSEDSFHFQGILDNKPSPQTDINKRYVFRLIQVVLSFFDSSKPWLLVQIDPKNAANDSPLQVELKSFPYSNKHFELVGETIKYLLDYKGLISSSELTVTRLDLAIDIQGDLSKVLIHKSKTRVTETSYGQDGKLRCIRLGRSRSKRYVVVYGKGWRESRTTKVFQGNKLRIEMRCRPRISLSDIIVSLNLQSFLSSIYLYDLQKVRSSNIFDSQTLRLCKHFGITPIVMSSKPATRKRLLRYLRAYQKQIISDSMIESGLSRIEKQLKLISNKCDK